MNEAFTELDPQQEIPLEALLTKPVHSMSDEELSRYRQELSLLRRPQTLTSKINNEGARQVKKSAVAKATVLANKYC